MDFVTEVIEQSVPKRPRLQGRALTPTGSVLFTGGIGDVLALEGHMTEQERAEVREVWLATRAASQIRDILRHLPGWQVEQFHTIQRDWARGPVYYKYELSEVPRHVIDWSIAVRFPEITSGKRTYTGASAYKSTSFDTEHARRIVIHPTTYHDRLYHDRYITPPEWDNIQNYLDQIQQEAVVIGADAEVPAHPLLLNLVGKTTIIESMEIIERAEIFIGVDSWPSVLAAQDAKKKLWVKSTNVHLYKNQGIYYAPRKTFDFVVRNFLNPRYHKR